MIKNTNIDLNKVTNYLTFFLRNKIFSEGTVVSLLDEKAYAETDKKIEVTKQFTTAEACWIQNRQVTAVVLTAPMQKAWYEKNRVELDIPLWEDKLLVSVWFAVLNNTGIPVPISHFGLVNSNWNSLSTPIKMTYLEEGSSKSLSRLQSNWCQLAFSLWRAQCLGATIPVEKTSSTNNETLEIKEA